CIGLWQGSLEASGKSKQIYGGRKGEERETSGATEGEARCQQTSNATVPTVSSFTPFATESYIELERSPVYS
ncbi:hypothetical protein STEG23_006600, partial [Scotinomys teguina]